MLKRSWVLVSWMTVLILNLSLQGCADANNNGSGKSDNKKIKVVAKLDGKPITINDLEKYAKMIPDDKYLKMLGTREGLRKLAELYIQRQIILEEAKKVISGKESVFASHKKLDTDANYIIAYLSKEIGEKVNVKSLKEDEIKSYMKKNNVTRQQAIAEITSKKRIKLFNELVERLKKEHKIEFYIGKD